MLTRTVAEILGGLGLTVLPLKSRTIQTYKELTFFIPFLYSQIS